MCDKLKDASSECTTAMFRTLKDGVTNEKLKAHCSQVYSVGLSVGTSFLTCLFRIMKHVLCL